MCSYDFPEAPNMWKYIACPNEAGCGKRDIYPKYDEITIREHEKYDVKKLFVLEDVCAYVIYAPEEMDELDVFHLRVSGIVNAELYVMKQPIFDDGRFMWYEHLETFINPS